MKEKEQSMGIVGQVKEVISAYGMMFRLAFDPREDPSVIEFFKQRKKRERERLKGAKYG